MAFARSPKAPHEKLGLGPDSRLLILGAAPIGSDTWPGERVGDDAGIVVVGCRSEADVVAHVPAGLAARRPDGRLWLAYRLGDRAFTRRALGDAVSALGLDLTWYRQVSLDGGWSAIWFKRRSEFRTLGH